LIEITASQKGQRCRIAKRGHARQLHGREVSGLVNDNLGTEQALDRFEESVTRLIKVAADSPVCQQATAARTWPAGSHRPRAAQDRRREAIGAVPSAFGLLVAPVTAIA